MDILTSENPQTGLSEKMLHSKLAISLRNNGTLDALKSQLRAKVLSDLRAGGIVPIKRSRTLFEEAALHIVMDHLRTGGFKCALSVFIPESGLPLSSMVESWDETRFALPLEMLGIRQNSRLDRHIRSGAAKSGSLLRIIVEYLSLENSDRVGFAESSSQTAVEESIDQKLKRIDEKFQGLLAAEQTYPMKSFEERRVQWQREADERLRIEVEEAVARVRRVEISKVRLEEQSRYQSMIAEVKSDWEKAYQKRLEDLQKREREASDRLERKRQEFEDNSYQHRQRMLAEMNLLRQRDAESKRQAELAQSTLHKQETRLKDLEHSLELKLIEAEKSAQQQAKENESALSRHKADLLREHEEGQRAAATAQRELETQTRQLQIAREAFNDALAESRLAREENVILRGDLERLRRQYEGVRQDLSAERDQLERRHAECENLNGQIDALKKQILELESLVSTLKTSTPISRPIEPLLTQLEEMRSSHSAERLLREKEIRKLNAELKAEKRNADQLKQQLTDLETEHSRCLARIREQADELNSAQKEGAERALELKMARHEVTDLRRLLEHSQVLLSKESSRAELHEIPGRSLRAARGHESSQTGFDTRVVPSLGVQRLLNQARSDAAEYAATTRPRPNATEMPADAWDVEFQRALQTIKQLEKEDLVLKQSRETLMNTSVRVVRIPPHGQAARKEEAMGAGFSRPDIVRPAVIDEGHADERQYRSKNAPGNTGLIDEDKDNCVTKTGPHLSHPSQQISIGSGPRPSALLVTDTDKRREQDLVNLDEEAARFLFDRSEKPAAHVEAGFQQPRRPAEQQYDKISVPIPNQKESQEADAERIRREESADESKTLRRNADEDLWLNAAQEERLKAEEAQKQLEKDEQRRNEAENVRRAEQEKEEQLNEKADFALRQQQEEERLHAEEAQRRIEEEHRRLNENAERLQREEARKQQEIEEQDRLQREEARKQQEIEEQDRLQREEARKKQEIEEKDRLQREEARKQQEIEEQDRLQREEARKQQEIEEQDRLQREEARKLQEIEEQDRLQREEARKQQEIEEQDRLQREEARKQQEIEEQDRLQREEARKQQEIEEQDRLQREEARKQQEIEEQDRLQREEAQEGADQILESEQQQSEEAELQLRLQLERERRRADEAEDLQWKADEELRLKEVAEQLQSEEALKRHEIENQEPQAEEARKQQEIAEQAHREAIQEQVRREEAELALRDKEEEQRCADDARNRQDLESKHREEEIQRGEEQRQRDEVELALRRKKDEEIQNEISDSERAQKAAEQQRQKDAAALALEKRDEELKRAEESRMQQEKDENDRRQNDERMRAQEIAAKTAEGENLILEFSQAIQNEDVSQAQESLRQARRIFQECGLSDHDSTLASCDEKLQLIRVQRIVKDAEQYLNSARHEIGTASCTPAVIVRARDSVQEAKKLLSQIPYDAKDARDTLLQSISVISGEIDAVESGLGAVEDEGTDHLYMQCFQQEEGNGTASDSPPHDNDTDLQQGSDGLEVQSFHYSSGGDVDDFAAHSVGSDENDFF